MKYRSSLRCEVVVAFSCSNFLSPASVSATVVPTVSMSGDGMFNTCMSVRHSPRSTPCVSLHTPCFPYRGRGTKLKMSLRMQMISSVI